MTGLRRFGPAKAVVSGILWAVVVTISQTMAELSRDLATGEFLQVFVGLGLAYAVGGILMSLAALKIEARLTGWKAWGAGAVAIVAALVAHIAVQYVCGRIWPGMGAQAMFTHVPDLREYLAFACWVGWVIAVYGGVYLGALILFLRSSRVQQQLRFAERARLLAESRVEQALTEDRTRLVRPTLVLDALAELGRTYSTDPERAENLLDALVRFLRGASSGGARVASHLALELEQALLQAKPELAFTNKAMEEHRT